MRWIQSESKKGKIVLIYIRVFYFLEIFEFNSTHMPWRHKNQSTPDESNTKKSWGSIDWFGEEIDLFVIASINIFYFPTHPPRLLTTGILSSGDHIAIIVRGIDGSEQVHRHDDHW